MMVEKALQRGWLKTACMLAAAVALHCSCVGEKDADVPKPEARNEKGDPPKTSAPAKLGAPAKLDPKEAPEEYERRVDELWVICMTTQTWLVEKGDVSSFPPSLKALLAAKDLIDKNRKFRVTEHEIKPSQMLRDYDTSLDRAGFTLTESMVPMSMLLAWEKEARFKGGRLVVLFDGERGQVTPKKFKRMLAEVDTVIQEHRPPKPEKP